MPLQRIPLSGDWTFHQKSSLNNACASLPLPVSQFPTVAHLDLLHHKLIPDPYLDTNELDCLWVNDADWIYRTTFHFPRLAAPDEGEKGGGVVEAGPPRQAHLVFEGLDTIVSVYLEGENMHLSYCVDVTSLLLQQSPAAPGTTDAQEHILELHFRNAPAHARSEMKRIGYKGNGTDVHFGGPERLFVRKAQYHWGWDWGPALNTCGPWKPIYLEIFSSRISEFLVRQTVAPDLETAIVHVGGLVESSQPGSGMVGILTLEVKGPTGELVVSQDVPVGDGGVFSADVSIATPHLWWPFTYGEQPLYTITANLCTSPSSPICDTQTRTIGLRRLRLLQEPLKNAPGTSFMFEINNTRIFCGGS
jgi:beta-mannosidase